MTELTELPPVKLAFIDSESSVMDILHTDERLAALFLSNPIIKNVTDIAQNNNVLGWSYNSETGEIEEKVSNPGNGLAEI
jgi:carbonic anhydrase